MTSQGNVPTRRLPAWFRPIYAVTKALADGLWVLGAAAFFVMSLTTFVQVVTRYVFNYPLPWTDELARTLFVWIIMIGSAVAAWARSHIAVTFFANKLPQAGRNAAAGIVVVVSWAFYMLLLYEGVIFAATNVSNVTSALRISASVAMASLAFGGLFMALFVTIRAIAALVAVEPRTANGSGAS